ncbi:hypothetical protein E2C01_096380 [Portunus trituberculatus]|uniref:Uncharacterized protein n=1 Tax=Portunus trituberculatus TaxID=210409 RepID=A0A5B7K833_PORTR|nr:hypothetical protein [Portunus trituberculatus]
MVVITTKNGDLRENHNSYMQATDPRQYRWESGGRRPGGWVVEHHATTTLGVEVDDPLRCGTTAPLWCLPSEVPACPPPSCHAILLWETQEEL